MKIRTLREKLSRAKLTAIKLYRSRQLSIEGLEKSLRILSRAQTLAYQEARHQYKERRGLVTLGDVLPELAQVAARLPRK